MAHENNIMIYPLTVLNTNGEELNASIGDVEILAPIDGFITARITVFVNQVDIDKDKKTLVVVAKSK